MPARPASRRTRGGPPSVCIVVSRYNSSITDRLLAGAQDAFSERFPGAQARVVQAPGSFELPALCLAAARTGRYHGIVALGCLIKGETSHDRVIADAVAHGLVGVSLATGLPVTFGVLTADTARQARERAGGAQGNKGADAMSAVLDVIAAAAALRAGSAVTPPRLKKHDKTRRTMAR
jgi:6,7-dimethyl-8-ribityllumazine synthase